MFPKNLIRVVTLLTLPVFLGSSHAASGLIGSPAPYFAVQSGDDKELTLDMIKGKVAAIFYESKEWEPCLTRAEFWGTISFGKG